MDSALGLKDNNNKKINLNNSKKIKLESLLFSKGHRCNKFFTDDSGLYFDCNNDIQAERVMLRTGNKFFDSVSDRVARKYKKSARITEKDRLYELYGLFVKRVNGYKLDIGSGNFNFLSNISVLRLWNASILTAIIIGMISMSFIYRYLGAGASATDEVSPVKEVAGAYIEKDENKWTKEKEEAYLMEMSEYLQAEADKDFDKQAMELVKGYPIEKMMPYILEKDRQVAAFYIAIAKKESNWGKRVPVLDGQDCFNYLGYRGKREKMGTGGHTCFDSRKEAVDVISKRIKELIEKYDRDTPEEMVVWKCGSNCAVTGGQAAANKWISDVDMYLEKLSKVD